MSTPVPAPDAADLATIETREWLESLDYVIQAGGPMRAARLLKQLDIHARRQRRQAALHRQHALHQHASRPTSSRRSRATARSSAASRASSAGTRWRWSSGPTAHEDGIGGHISTFASAATLYEVGFNHFFRGRGESGAGRPHLLPGPRLARHLRPRVPRRPALERPARSFRREARQGGGLSSYPHPWLMPDFWEFPTVSMGLGPIMAIYQARFNRYLRGPRPQGHERPARSGRSSATARCDEPESLGAITLASREKLDNLIFVINCNLQRLDGPVRGNGKIIQELEAVFRGAGWNVIKVIWGGDWDPLLATRSRRPARQAHGRGRRRRVSEVHRRAAAPTSASTSSASIRELLELVEHLSDEQLQKLRRGGHDPEKVYAAYQGRRRAQGRADGDPRQDDQGLRPGRSRRRPQHHPPAEEAERGRAARVPHAFRHSDLRRRGRRGAVLPARRRQRRDASICASAARRSAGSCRARRRGAAAEVPPLDELFDEFFKGTEGRKASTTMAFVRMLAKLLRDKEIGKLIVPIVPDEARTFGMDALFRQFGIYSHAGQLYEPVDIGHARCTTAKRRTARSSRKASPRPARWRRSSPRARPTRRTAST